MREETTPIFPVIAGLVVVPSSEILHAMFEDVKGKNSDDTQFLDLIGMWSSASMPRKRARSLRTFCAMSALLPLLRSEEVSDNGTSTG